MAAAAMPVQIASVAASGTLGPALGIADGNEDDDPDECRDGAEDRAAGDPLVGEPRAQRQREDEAQGDQRLDDREAARLERERLEEPADALERGAHEPVALAEDLDQEPRVALGSLRLERAALLERRSERERQRGKEREEVGRHPSQPPMATMRLETSITTVTGTQSLRSGALGLIALRTTPTAENATTSQMSHGNEFDDTGDDEAGGREDDHRQDGEQRRLADRRDAQPRRVAAGVRAAHRILAPWRARGQSELERDDAQRHDREDDRRGRLHPGKPSEREVERPTGP